MQKRSSKIGLVLLNLVIILCIILICTGPMLSTFIAGSIANTAGCQLDEGSVHPCVIGGMDVGEQLYTMGMMFWFAFFSAPVSIALLLVYLLAAGLLLVRKNFRKREKSL